MQRARDACANKGHQVKERQLERQTQSYHVVNTDQTVNPKETVPEYQMVNKPISENPVYQYTPSANAQLQQTIHMVNRMRGASRVIRNNEGRVIKIINR